MKDSYTLLSLGLNNERKSIQQKSTALLRIIISYLALALFILVGTTPDKRIILILAGIGIYSTLVFLIKKLWPLLSGCCYTTVIIDELLIFVACYYSGGLHSPFVLAYILPVLVWAVNSSLKRLFKITALTLLFIGILGILTDFDIIQFVFLSSVIVIVGLLVNTLVYNELRIISSVASKDGLTGLYTHQFFFDQLALFMSEDCDLSCFSLIMIDLNEFKRLNDEKGHLQGDRVLKEVADTIVLNIRQSDIAARYGGDEFAIILPGVGYHLCQSIIERLRTAIIDLGYFENVSIGSALYPDEATEIEKLVELADARMYNQKKLQKQHT